MQSNMKSPDKDTVHIWTCFILSGVLVSFALLGFAAIPMMYTVWFTVPICLALGAVVQQKSLLLVAETPASY